MKLAVVAANGRSGRVFVERALAAGHTVCAGVFTSNTLTPHDRLTVIHCDATNKSDLEKLIEGQDAVVSFIGHVRGSRPWVQSEAAEAIVSVMNKQRVKRLVSLTGTGVRFDGDRIPLIDRVLNLAIGVIDPARVNDGKRHVKILEASDLEWTVLRVLKLQNTKAMDFTLTLHGPTKWYVGREEVAEAMLRVIEEDTFIRQAPIISRP